MPQAEDLVRRIREGDVEALSQFIESRRPQLLVFIERKLGAGLRRKIEPEDVFQEMATYAVRALPNAQWSGESPFGWLCQIAEQRIVDAHRRFFAAQKRNAGREIPLGEPSGRTSRAALVDLLIVSMTTPTRAMARDQRHQKLREVLATLPPEGQEAIRLRYVENLASKEIAERLGKSDGAVRVLLTRSLRKLQELLGPDFAP
jgi:RNA polymerase sigma-70 factor (ECF subfamily)